MIYCVKEVGGGDVVVGFEVVRDRRGERLK
jgi:hypothetical protein